jgi:hypothetical protein
MGVTHYAKIYPASSKAHFVIAALRAGACLCNLASRDNTDIFSCDTSFIISHTHDISYIIGDSWCAMKTSGCLFAFLARCNTLRIAFSYSSLPVTSGFYPPSTRSCVPPKTQISRVV